MMLSQAHDIIEYATKIASNKIWQAFKEIICGFLN